MAEGTSIEWTDHTFNPWWGCEKVSPGCAHCYADTLAKRRAPGKQLWGAGHEFRFFGDGHWHDPVKWNRKAEAEGVRRRVFCASMADVFEERIELDAHRERLFDLIEATPHLDWQVLTKRPDAAADFMRAFYWGDYKVLPNLWLGVSIENARHVWRADVLREIPAAVRFLSCEPLLGSLYTETTIDCTACGGGGGECYSCGGTGEGRKGHDLGLAGIDWVIIGGESGHGARPFREEWADEIVEACRPDVAPFVKQFGSVWAKQHGADGKGGDWSYWPERLRVREFPQAAVPA